MLLDGESQIVLTDSDEVVIILGISGSGKSTLLQFLTGDNEKLIATKVRNVMIIKDTNNKIGSTTKSHTKIPELSVDQFGNNFYDCPGFKDTNDAIYDIASGYFIKGPDLF
jgi:ABC-type multidrug transport system ATPase subunit